MKGVVKMEQTLFESNRKDLKKKLFTMILWKTILFLILTIGGSILLKDLKYGFLILLMILNSLILLFEKYEKNKSITIIDNLGKLNYAESFMNNTQLIKQIKEKGKLTYLDSVYSQYKNYTQNSNLLAIICIYYAIWFSIFSICNIFDPIILPYINFILLQCILFLPLIIMVMKFLKYSQKIHGLQTLWELVENYFDE